MAIGLPCDRCIGRSSRPRQTLFFCGSYSTQVTKRFSFSLFGLDRTRIKHDSSRRLTEVAHFRQGFHRHFHVKFAEGSDCHKASTQQKLKRVMAVTLLRSEGFLVRVNMATSKIDDHVEASYEDKLVILKYNNKQQKQHRLLLEWPGPYLLLVTIFFHSDCYRWLEIFAPCC